MKKRWRGRPEPDTDILTTLAKELRTSPILLRLIAQRQLHSLQQAQAFFVHDLGSLHPPMQMKGMAAACARIHKAIQQKEKILVYGDYDVDGATAVALVYSYMLEIHPAVEFYIPDRFSEGYGISFKGIDHAIENGTGLVIALDCGIKSIAHVKKAKENGIDFIICDHHLPGEELPDAIAILNPKQDGCPYPFKELSGCGIGYKLIQAYDEMYGPHTPTEEYLDLVSVSIASDIVSMTGENRTMVYYGMQKLNEKKRPGISALIETSGLKRVQDVNDLVFRLGPRINAAGRIARGSLAVELLIEKSPARAMELASGINKKNTDRQEVDHNITQEALEMIRESGQENNKTTVLYHTHWHKGVIGIVASRLIETYYRPTILFTESSGLLVGSARSVPGFDLYAAIEACDGLLTQWGGHHAAAGLSMAKENFDAFRQLFEDTVRERILPELLIPSLEYDTEIAFQEITPSFCRSIERFGPFGPDNMKPLFVSRNIRSLYPSRIVGKDHLKFEAVDAEGKRFPAIAFGMAEWKDKIDSTIFDICYTVEPDTFRGGYNVCINIKDIQLAI